MLAHVVGPDDRRPALVRRDRRREAGGQRAGRGRWIAEDPTERALAREADDYGPAEGGEDIEPSNELEVLLHGLAEADAGIEADSFFGDPRSDGET